MYIHLGRDYVLNDRDIIGIFNLETTTISPRGREFLNYAQKNGAVVSLSEELPQCYVLADAPDADFKIVAQTEEASHVAIPLRKADASATLLEAVNNAIDELRADGTLKELSEKYFGQDISSEN